MKRLLVFVLAVATIIWVQPKHMADQLPNNALYYDENAGANGQLIGGTPTGNQVIYSMPGSVEGDSTVATPPPANTAAATTTADDLAYLNDQSAQLRDLLSRTDTGLTQGLTQNQDQYDTAVGGATTDKNNQVQAQNTAKLGAYDTINQNAGNGYRSLAQIIGRAAGTGSSAFQDLLPDVIGKDTSSKRLSATNTYGQNLSNIDNSFAGVLSNLLQQKKTNEDTLRTGIETQRQSINDQLSQNAGQVAQANGGGYAAVKAAQAPFQSAINNSRNTVDSFFDQFRTPYTPPTLDPNLATYDTDRSVVNAGADPSNPDPTDPYTALLRKKLQAA